MSLVSIPFVNNTADTVLHGVAAFVLILSISAAVIAFWKIHELPIHKAHATEHRQIGLITILTWIGFVWHWVWVLATIIAFIDFEKAIIHLREIWQEKPSNVKEKTGGESC
ncbi:MFS transporter [Vibrio maerlii]|uniref:MFS transporter n=1 Tax=Vibrio maerlii TaxID=2231648 RepID=UPI000E3CA056|nr:MFS transporter [Vibrio maerlii]